jgi:Flp pilus assembly protein TadB
MRAVAAALLGVAVLMWCDGGASSRRLDHLRRTAPGPAGRAAAPERAGGPRRRPGLPGLPAPPEPRTGAAGWRRAGAALLAGAAVALLVGGGAGVVAGAAVALGLDRWLTRAEPAAARRRRERLAAAGPLVAGLVAACLEAGVPLPVAVRAAAQAVGGPAAELLVPSAAALELGAPPASAWAGLEGGSLAALGRQLARSARTGSSPVEELRRWAQDRRAQARVEASSAARSSGARAAAPLGLCFLPAFVLVGVVPLVAGLAAGLLR